MQFPGFNTGANEYTYEIAFTYDGENGEVTARGVHNFTALPTVENVVVTETNGDFVITFDEVQTLNLILIEFITILIQVKKSKLYQVMFYQQLY